MMKWLLHKLGISQLIADFRNQLFVLNDRQTQHELRISRLKDEINYLNRHLKIDVDVGSRGECTVILTGVYRDRAYVEFYDMSSKEFANFVTQLRHMKKLKHISTLDLPRTMSRSVFNL